MIDIENYVLQLIELLKKQFGERLLYVGLQGSYLRGEANQNSDIDIMVVVDGLSVSDLDSYRRIISSMDHSEKSCGFICSKDDLINWNPLEICNLLHSTKDYFGVLREFVPVYTEGNIRNFVKISVNNLYHELCHRYIHANLDRNYSQLPATYKGVFFILQNLYFLKYNEFIGTKAGLMMQLRGKDREVLKHAIELDNATEYAFNESFELLFSWCQETLHSL